MHTSRALRATQAVAHACEGGAAPCQQEIKFTENKANGAVSSRIEGNLCNAHPNQVQNIEAAASFWRV